MASSHVTPPPSSTISFERVMTKNFVIFDVTKEMSIFSCAVKRLSILNCEARPSLGAQK